MTRWITALAVLAASLPLLAAEAGAAEAWKPETCGTEPAAPHIDLSSIAKYNDSVKQVAEYQKAAQAYNTCVRKEAKAKIDAINEGATAIQKRIWDNFDRYGTAFKAAEKKFSGKG